MEKFDFALSFDEDDADGGAGENGRSRGAKAKIEEAYETGRTAGLAEAQATIERQSAAALEGIVQGLGSLRSSWTEIEETTTRQALEVATTLVGKALPTLAGGEAMPAVMAVIAECLPRVLAEPRIVIRVHDALLDAVQAKVGGMAERAGFAGQVVLLADPALGPSDCRVEWADGGAERDLAALWQEIEAAVERALADPGQAGAPPTAETNTDSTET